MGKSRLVEEFVERSRVPHAFFAATGRPLADELRLFCGEVAASDLPGAGLFRGVQVDSWDAALRLLARALPDSGSVVVLDEMPYLVANDPGFEATLQRAFDRAVARVRAGWTSWRGRAIEPVIREAIDRISPPAVTAPRGIAPVVGGYWTRINDPEIDLVLADRAPIAQQLFAVGSIKWLEEAPFSATDLGALIRHRARLPGATEETPLVVASRSGCAVDGVVHLSPETLLQAYRT